MQPTSPPPDLQPVKEMLAAHSDMLGGIQDHLAQTANAQIGAMAQSVADINGNLKKTVQRVRKVNSKITGNVMQTLGLSVGNTLAQNSQTISALGAAAASGAVQPAGGNGAVPSSSPAPSLPAGSGGTIGLRWTLYWHCPTAQRPFAEMLAFPFTPDNDAAMLAAGWRRVLPELVFDNQIAALEWMQVNRDTYLADNCPPTMPSLPPSGGGGGGSGAPPPSIGPGAPVSYHVYAGYLDRYPCPLQVVKYYSQLGGETNNPNAPACGTSLFAKIVDTGIWLPVSSPPAEIDLFGCLVYGIGTDGYNKFQAWVAANVPGCPAPAGPGAPPALPPPACPPPPVCTTVSAPAKPPDCTTDIPPLACPMLVNGKLPEVGSAEWCQCIDALVLWFDGIGQWLINKIDEFVSSGSEDNPGDDVAQGVRDMGGALLSALGLGKMADAITSAGEYVACIWRAVKDVAVTFAVMTSTKLIGLSVCRAVLRAFEKLRFGTDAAVWLTIDLEIRLQPLERLLRYIEEYTFQYDIPSQGEAIECYKYNTATVDQIKCWMACHGANFDVYSPVIQSRRERLDTREAIQWMRRNGYNAGQQQVGLRYYGWINPEDAAATLLLYDELPSISEHLHWLQRGVFDQQYVTDYRLDEGFEDRFWSRFGADLYAQGYTKPRAYLEYAAHWITPAIGQLAEMAYRLRPGRVSDDLVFTWEDFSRVLVEQDVAPYFRPRLQTIAYRTLPLRQLNQAVQQGRFDAKELAERFQDIGFYPDDAELLAATYLTQAARQVATQTNGYTAHMVAEMLQWGLIPVEYAPTLLDGQGFTAAQITTMADAAKDRRKLLEAKKHDEATVDAYAKLALSAYEDGAASADGARQALVDAGYSASAADLAIATVALRNRKATVDSAARAVRKAFLTGGVDAAAAVNALTGAGIIPDMAATYVARWQLELTVPRVAASTWMILRWAKKQVISIPNAAARLANLGWLQGDIDLSLLEIEQEITAAQSAAKAKTAKALEQAQRNADSAKRATQRAFCRLYTPAKMVRWYRLRIIDDEQFTARLGRCGYTDTAVANLLAEAQVARAAADATAAKKGSAGVEYTGPGADTGNGTAGPAGG